jgi:hypothetical protein
MDVVHEPAAAESPGAYRNAVSGNTPDLPFNKIPQVISIGIEHFIPPRSEVLKRSPE